MEKRRVSSAFNFLEAIGKPGVYNALFPAPEIGLAISKLYMQVQTGAFPEGRFKEADILRALQDARKQCLGNYERIPREHLISIISSLQEYFIRYDGDEQVYTLKTYAEKFCKSAFEVLEADFNPTEIDRICRTLRNELQACEVPDDLAAWMKTGFETFRPNMKRQVDYLEHQLDISVAEISAAIKSEGVDLLFMLKDIGEKLDRIRRQNAELQSAFREMSSVNNLLVEKLDTVSDPELIASGKAVRQFFPHIKYSLKLIDSRLDRLQPKLRLFFNELSKPSFKKGVDKLLNFLLEQSTLVPYKSGKRIAFPRGVPVFQLRCGAPNFKIVEWKELSLPKTARILTKSPETAEIVERDNSQLASKLAFRNQVDAWLARLEERCREEGHINFSDMFFQIVADEAGDIDLACNVGYALLISQVLRPMLRATTTTEVVRNEAFKGLSIVEIKIDAVL